MLCSKQPLPQGLTNRTVFAAGVQDHAVAHGSRGRRRSLVLIPNIVSGGKIAWIVSLPLGCRVWRVKSSPAVLAPKLRPTAGDGAAAPLPQWGWGPRGQKRPPALVFSCTPKAHEGALRHVPLPQILSWTHLAWTFSGASSPKLGFCLFPVGAKTGAFAVGPAGGHLPWSLWLHSMGTDGAWGHLSKPPPTRLLLATEVALPVLG